MEDDVTILLEIRGYADPTGDSAYNLRLSRRRADAVKFELIEKWGIDDRRILSNGQGRLLLPGNEYNHTSRRCDLFLSR